MAKDPKEQLNKNGNRRGMSSGSRKELDKGRKRGNGKPNGFPITSALREMIDQPCDERWLNVEDKGKGLTWRQAIAKSMLCGAIAGKPGIISELLDRLEGKITQPIGGDESMPIVASFKFIMPDGSEKTASEIAHGK